MNTWVRRSLKAGVLTAGAVMATGTAAYADTTLISADNTGILNGTQVFAPIQAPINLCGVAAAVGGSASAGCEGGSAASLKGLYNVKMISAGNTGLLNGTQVFAPIQAPINVCGVAVAVLGGADAGCEGGSSAQIGKDKHHYGKKHKTESGLLPLAGGLPLGNLPLVGPLLSGILGGGSATNFVDVDTLDSVGTITESTEGGRGTPPGCGTTCPPPPPPPGTPCPPGHGHGKDVKLISAGNTGILNGTQIYAPIQVPVNVSGIAAGVLGDAAAWSDGGASARG